MIVIGSGAGMNIVSNAAQAGWKVGLVEQGPLGGTCLNNGCIPSKILVYPADVIRIIQDARAVGVDGSIAKIDFSLIMRRMRAAVDMGRGALERSIEENEKINWLKGAAEFTDDKILKCMGRYITAPRIVIASGARAQIPPLPGLKKAGYLDNISVLGINSLPKSLLIIGGGYIACEFGHFFAAMGTDVTIIGRSFKILKNEDPEISDALSKALSKNMKIYLGYEALKVAVDAGKKVVFAKNRSDESISKFEADEILVAAGRRSNSDLLRPERTGVETDKQGWIIVNEYLETSRQSIWALGDAIGKHMYRHTANYEADIVWQNITGEVKAKADFHAVPHAVFTHPPVAGVGVTENEAVAAGYRILVGRAAYSEVAKGYAVAEEGSFAKVIVEEETGKILGCSIVGSEAPELIQQVVYLMNTESQDLGPVIRSQVIHPAMSEILVRAFARLQHPEHFHGDEDNRAKES